MDWTSIINTVVGLIFGGGIVSFVTIKAAKKKGESEAKSYDNKEQSERIDLGDKYVDKVLDLMKKMSKSSEDGKNSNKDSFDKICEKIDVVHNEVVDVKKEIGAVKTEVGLMVSYLNGGYQAYKCEHESNDAI